MPISKKTNNKLIARMFSKRGLAQARRMGLHRKWGRKSRLPLAPTGSFASRSETFSKAITAGQVYDINNLSLADLPVCSQLAEFYQYYRITSIQMRFKPNTDTYISNGAGGSTTGYLPYLYFLYDKSGSLGLLNANQFEEAGAKPNRLDDKTILRKWRPSVITGTVADSITQFKTSPWLPTHDMAGVDVNDVYHLGAVFYITKTNPNDTQTYDIDITVTVQFRKPMVQLDQQAQRSTAIMDITN